jgi:hypothetical protein
VPQQRASQVKVNIGNSWVVVPELLDPHMEDFLHYFNGFLIEPFVE